MRRVGLFFWEVIVRLGLAYLVMESLLRLNPSGRVLGFAFMVLVVLFFSGLNRIGDLIREDPYFKQLELEKQFSFVFLLFVLNVLIAVGLLLVSFSPDFCEIHREFFFISNFPCRSFND